MKRAIKALAPGHSKGPAVTHIKAILFDLDETLLDRTQSLRDFALWQAQNMLKDTVADAPRFVDRFVALDAHGMVWKDRVYAALIDEFKIEHWTAAELLQSYELCFCAFAKPKEGCVDAIKTLHTSGYKLGLVSNGRWPFQERNFRALGLAVYFDTVVVSGAVGCKKPQLEIFTLACEDLKTHPQEVVFVGDSPTSDMEGARAAGMHAIYIPGHHGPTCPQAHATCTHFSRLPALISSLNDA